MLSVACLLNDTELLEDLKSLVEAVGYDMAAELESAPLGAVYSQIRSMGIEVDLKTIGTIYAEVLPVDEAPFSSISQINKLIKTDFVNLLYNINNIPSPITDNETGILSPEEKVVNNLGQLFFNSKVTKTEFKSDMLILQEALLKGAKSLTGKLDAKPKNKQEWTKIVSEALEKDAMGIPTLFGTVNNLETLFDAMKVEIDNVLAGIKDPLRKAEFEQYVNGIKNASYGLMLTKTEAKNMLNDIMKEAGFTKQLSDGTTVLDWVKLSGNVNDVIDLRNNVTKVLEQNNYSKKEISLIKNSLEFQFHQLSAEIVKKADRVLQQRTGINKQGKPIFKQKSDIERLVELKNLKVFDSAHQKALYKAIGVDAMTRADIEKIKDISDLLDGIAKDANGKTFSEKEFFASYAFKTLQKQMNDLVSANINDKTAALKAIRAIDYYFQVKATGLIMNYANMAENNISGAIENMSMNLQMVSKMGVRNAFKDFDLFMATWKDVADGNIAFNTGDNRFGDFSQAERSISKRNTWLKSFLYWAMTPARYLLSGSDNAYKALLTKKSFMLSLHQALVQSGKTSKEANEFINEALYGQNLEDAKVKAEDILVKYDLPVNNNSITRLADDLVKANLMTGGKVDFDLIEAAYKSGYKVAGVGLGHEAPENNLLGLPSRLIQGQRNNMKQKEDRLRANGDTSALANHKIFGVFFSQLFLFVGGQFNWLQLRLDKTGMGIVTGFLGDFNSDLDFENKDKLAESMYKVRQANQKIARGIVGATYGLIMFSVVSALFKALFDDDKDEDGFISSLMNKIDSNAVTRRLFKKMAPEWAMFLYYDALANKNIKPEEFKNQSFLDRMGIPGNYVRDAFNIGDNYSAGSKLDEAFTLSRRSRRDDGTISEKTARRADGKFAEVIGDKIELPLWRPYKSYWQLVTWGDPDLNKPYHQPDTFLNGLMQGGIMDGLGVFSKQRPLTSLPGVNDKKKEQLQGVGYKNSNQLFKNKDWEGVTDKDGNRIFTDKQAQKIKEVQNEW